MAAARHDSTQPSRVQGCAGLQAGAEMRALPPISPEPIAVLTLDYELDYGHRTGQANCLYDREGLERLAAITREYQAPLSLFIRTDLFELHPVSVEIAFKLGQDFHVHSHSHPLKGFDTEYELSACAEAFQNVFGHRPIGYRAPYGILYPSDIDVLHGLGYRFSSSIFPSLRPGKFNHINKPINPFLYANGIMEFPHAVIPTLRYPLTISYMKLVSWFTIERMINLFGLTRVVVIDTHLHDFMYSEKSFSMLPRRYRLLWGMRRRMGWQYLERLLALLRHRGYRFTTMTNLHAMAQRAVNGGAPVAP